MCAEGVLPADPDGIGAALQREARSRLAAGPPPAPAVALEDRRYAPTDTLDGLRGCTDPEGPGRFTAAVEEDLDR
ncbi:hypothetical protein K353_01275 [Kitasatospora sp. SolWspMP-SS2h]|nr:hypothetical protein K353_01275 [Kitasatospora sp. SolWspMP-SS2h]